MKSSTNRLQRRSNPKATSKPLYERLEPRQMLAADSSFWVYYGEGSKIYRSLNDGTQKQTLLTSTIETTNAFMFDLDRVNNKIYMIANSGHNPIHLYSANLDGSNLQLVNNSSDMGTITQGVAVNELTNDVYVSPHHLQAFTPGATPGGMLRISKNGQSLTKFSQMPWYVTDMEVDAANGHVYYGVWPSWAGNQTYGWAGIRRMNLDGSNDIPIFQTGGVGSFALDTANNRIWLAATYTSTLQNERIYTVDMNGGNLQEKAIVPGYTFGDIDLSESKDSIVFLSLPKAGNTNPNPRIQKLLHSSNTAIPLFDTPGISSGIELLSANNSPTLDPISDLTILENSELKSVTLKGITAGDGESQPIRVTAISSNPTLIATPTVNFQQSTFATAVSYTAQNTTHTVTTGDFNGDGMLDFAASNQRSGTASVLFGDGTGKFEPALNLSMNGQPYFSLANDFNNDGIDDLVVSNFESNLVTIRLGNSQGTFSSSLSYPTGDGGVFPANTGVWYLNSGDFNNDGKKDLITANIRHDFVSILLGNGQGGFGLPTKIDVGPAGSLPHQTGPHGISVGDFNADGKLDAAVAVMEIGTVKILTGDGTGKLVVSNSYKTGARALGLTAGDLDNDGKTDLAVIDDSNSAATILKGNGNGTFTVKNSFTFGELAREITSGDIDRDGNVDLLASADKGKLFFAKGIGDGTFLTPVTYSTGGTNYINHFSILADFNRDGFLDIGSALYQYQATGAVSVLLNKPVQGGSLEFQPESGRSGTSTITVTVEDGGRDGNLTTTADNASFSRTFLVTVNAVNDTPTLDSLSNLSLGEDAPQQTVNLAGITAGGGESQPLRVTASSNNTALIPNPAVNYTSPNTTGSLSFTPIANQSGVATITVTVEDGGLDGNLTTTADNESFSRTFQVTVNANNDTPTLDALGDITLPEDSASQTVNLAGITAGFGELQPLKVTALSSNPSLIPHPTVNYTSPNPTGSISFTPVADQFGTTTITVTVEDGGLDENLATTADNLSFSRSFQVTVTPVNEPPTLAPIANVTLEEDSLESFVDLLGISAGGTKSQPLRVIALSSNTTLLPNPLVNYQSPSPAGSLRLRPGANQHGTTTVTVTVEDGGVDQDLATLADNASVSRSFIVTVTPVNDSPEIRNFGTDLSFIENGPAVRLAASALVSDPDTTDFAGGRLTVRFTAGAQPDDRMVILPTAFLTVSGANLQFGGVTVATWSGGSGGLPLQIDFLAKSLTSRVQHILQNIAFQNSSEAPGSAPREITVELIDDAGGSSSDHLEPVKQVMVTETNDSPAIGNFGGNLSYTEGDAPLRLASGLTLNDPDSPDFAGGQAVIQITAGSEATDRLVILPSGSLTLTDTQLLFGGTVIATYSGGAGASPLTISFNSLALRARVQLILQQIAFRSLADEPGLATRTVTFQLSDGDGGSSTILGKQVQVLPSNDAPQLTNLGGTVNYVEGALPIRLAEAASVSDVDSPNFAGGQLSVSFLSGYQAGDELSILSGAGLSLAGNSLLLQGTAIGTYSGGTSGVSLVLSFNAQATASAVQTALQQLAFRHSTENPSAQPRLLAISLSDGDGGSTGLLNKLINVTPVNNPPLIGGIGGLQYYKKNSAAVFIASGATLSDVDNTHFNGGKLTVRITGGANSGNRLLIGGGFGVDPNGGVWWQGVQIGTRNPGGGLDFTNLEITFNANATTAIVQELMRSIQFQTVRAKGSTNRVVEFQLNDGAGANSNLLSKQITFKRIR